MAVDVREGAVKLFHFAEIINEWLLNESITEIRVRFSNFFDLLMYVSLD